MAAGAGGVLAIAGVGLLGGSVALAAREAGLFRRVIGIGRNAQRLQAAVDAGVLDAFRVDPSAADAEWDFVVVATPVDRIVADVRQLAAISRPGTIITDVGSVKRVIVEALSSALPTDIEFVGSHPLAGSHRHGFEVARADLFQNRLTVVTPSCDAAARKTEVSAASCGASHETSSETVSKAVSRVVGFWTALGARVLQMDAAAHDAALAVTSHLPHVTAAALAALLTPELRDFAATGFRDSTRIAAGDADLWVPILLNNAEAVLRSLDSFRESLDGFREAIREHDAIRLQELLHQASLIRCSLNE